MLIGYARISTNDQNLDMQKDALRKAGCESIFVEKMSGGLDFRPELDRTMKALSEGDNLAVWRLDRLGRSLRHLIELTTELEERDRIEKPDRSHRHNDCQRETNLPYLRCSG